MYDRFSHVLCIFPKGMVYDRYINQAIIVPCSCGNRAYPMRKSSGSWDRPSDTSFIQVYTVFAASTWTAMVLLRRISKPALITTKVG